MYESVTTHNNRVHSKYEQQKLYMQYKGYMNISKIFLNSCANYIVLTKFNGARC